MNNLTTPDFESAKEYVFRRLETELSSKLFYHGVHHTRDDVLPAFERLSELEGVSEEDLVIGRTAALYHDVGYLEQYAKNEPIGVRIARETLPGFGYAPNQIERVGEVIMATQLQMVAGKLIQVPDRNDLLQMIMCDADLDTLGRDDWFSISESLRRELKEYGIYQTPRQWAVGSLDFQENHSYFTNAAQRLRNEGKQRNITELKDLLRVA